MSDDGCDFYVKELMRKKKYFIFFRQMKHYQNSNETGERFRSITAQGMKFHRDNNKQVPSFRKMNSPAMSVKAVRKM